MNNDGRLFQQIVEVSQSVGDSSRAIVVDRLELIAAGIEGKDIADMSHSLRELSRSPGFSLLIGHIVRRAFLDWFVAVDGMASSPKVADIMDMDGKAVSESLHDDFMSYLVENGVLK